MVLFVLNVYFIGIMWTNGNTSVVFVLKNNNVIFYTF